MCVCMLHTTKRFANFLFDVYIYVEVCTYAMHLSTTCCAQISSQIKSHFFFFANPGLFFHKYGHMSAVVGALGGDLKLVWNLAARAAAPPLAGAPVPDDPAGRLALGGTNATAAAAPGGGDNSVTVGANSTKGVAKGEGEEEGGGGISDASGGGVEDVGEGAGGGDRRERALKDLVARGGEAGSNPGARSGPRRLEQEPRYTEQVAAAAAAGRAGAVSGWLRSEKEVGEEGPGAGGGLRGAVSRSGRTGGLRR